MVASRADTSNPARIPALGIRLAALLILSIVLMVLDHRQNHLQAVRQAIGAAVYPLQIAVDAPFRLWEWVREGTSERNQLQLELSRLQAERLLTNARLQRMTALEAENARLRVRLTEALREAGVAVLHEDPLGLLAVDLDLGHLLDVEQRVAQHHAACDSDLELLDIGCAIAIRVKS